MTFQSEKQPTHPFFAPKSDDPQDFWLRRNEIDYTAPLRLASDAVVGASIRFLFAWPTAFLAVIRASNQERLF
jgi:hypothetical protein